MGNIESPKFKHKYTIKQIHNFCNYLNFPFEKIFLEDRELEKPTSEVINALIVKLIEYEKNE